MTQLSWYLLLTAAIMSQSGCQTQPQQELNTPLSATDIECIGGVTDPRPDALDKVESTLVPRAQNAAGKGGLCVASAFRARSSVRVYRIWDVTRPNSAFGRWWSLSKPTGSKASYRQAFGICPEYSALDRLISCNIKFASTIVIGTTQSAECQDGTVLPKTNTLQVYIPNDLYNGLIFVDDCKDEDLW